MLQGLPNEEYRFVRRTIIGIVLATDMGDHSRLTKVSNEILVNFAKQVSYDFVACCKATKPVKADYAFGVDQAHESNMMQHGDTL